MPSTMTYKPVYATPAAITITLDSLGSSGTWVAGRQSNEIDNSGTLYDDILLSLKFTVGSGSANAQINLFAVAWDPQSNAYPDVITGAGDAAKTWTSANVQAAGAVLLKTMITDSTASRAYYATGISVAAAFGGVLPQKFVLFVAQNVSTSDATAGNFALTMQGIQWQAVG